MASAMSSAGVKVGRSAVRALLTHGGGLDRIDDDDVGGGAGAGEGVGEGQGPGLRGGLGRGVGGVGVLGVLRGGGGDEHEAAVLAAGECGVEGAAGELQGADEQVVQELVVREIEALDRLAAAIAADQVEEAVDVAEALLELGGPVVGGGLVEEVDGAPVEAVVGEAEVLRDGVRGLLAAVGEGEGWRRRRRGAWPRRARGRRRRRRSRSPFRRGWSSRGRYSGAHDSATCSSRVGNWNDVLPSPA